MLLDNLLVAGLNSALGLMAKVGFEDTLKGLKKQLTKKDEKERRNALSMALEKAIKLSTKAEDIRPLLELPRVQQEIAAYIMDPSQLMDLQGLKDLLSDHYPKRVRLLRNFFNVFENALMEDKIWGPILERFQEARFRNEVVKKLKEEKLDFSSRELVKSVSAYLDGSGAIAQEGGVAAGDGGIAIGGSVDKVVQVVIKKMSISSPPPDKTHSLRYRYLLELSREANLLPWASVNLDYADPEKGETLSLSDVYTDIDTMELKEVEGDEAKLREFMIHIQEKKRIPAQEVVSRQQRAVIMGDPGSGKSTFLKYLAYVLAQAALAEDPSIWLNKLAPWSNGILLPMYIELRQFAVFAEEHCKQTGKELILLNYLHHLLTVWKLEGFWKELDKAVREGKEDVIFLLDGLDEAPTTQRRSMIDMINEFCKRYKGHRYIVTCRPYAYVGQPCRLKGFYEVTLAPFSGEQIDQFVKNWYDRLVEGNCLSRQDSEKRRERLQRALRRPDLKGLAERPLLLTVMVQLHSFRGKLPEDRIELYTDAVDILLSRWEGRLSKEEGLMERLGIPQLKMSDLEAGLYKVAFKAHERLAERETSDITEAELREWLAPYLGDDWNKAGRFVEYIRERAGLLIRHKTDAYTFPHRTFQEFLAACFVTSADFKGDIVKLVRGDMNRWREVFLLSVGHSARNHRLSQAIGVVNALCPFNVDDIGGDDPKELRVAQLVGEALLETNLLGVQRDQAGKAVLNRVKKWLVAALKQDKALAPDKPLAPKERVAAGRVLAKLGDLREDVLSAEKMIFCTIPSGPFTMGSKDDPRASGEEKPQHHITIPYEYWISKFPVTNAQFQAFALAGGYREKRYWKEAESAGYWKEGRSRGYRFDMEFKPIGDEWIDMPVDYGEPFSLPNHPVVGITWYEALAFTRWLTERLQEVGVLAKDWVISLPSEAEWEKAARGKDTHIYPWGDLPDSNRGNYNETGIATTSPVGCFPGGASPFGVEELSGNVWEWTRSLWGKKYEKPDFVYDYNPKDGREDLSASPDVLRVVRGGSCYLMEYDVRCAVRYRHDPYLRAWYYGFRVVASPFTSEL